MNDEAKHHPTIPITIDGRQFDVERGEQETAADLLRLAGLDPNGYDLAVVQGHDVRTFADDQRIDVHPHEKFVTVRQTAPVA